MPAAAPLLTTKLYIPRGRSKLVPRPRLTARLNEATEGSLTLISAPPGFGKTTLLAEWIPSSEWCVIWDSLDAGDNDPARFWSYVIAALQMLNVRLGENAQALLQSPQMPSTEFLLTLLLNDIAAFPQAFALVLDDYHVIENPALHDALAFWMDHLPPHMHLVIASRADPPLPLARWRARGQMTELRADDLRFTPDEAATFLNEVMGLSLSAANVAALDERTEGWIAGLQLAALSMQGRQDLSGFIAAFTGSNRYIIDYLAEEVLQRQPADIQTFLLQTSILDRLSGPLCDAVVERVAGQGHSQAALERLERSNLFVISLDDQRQWYRYHHLFAEVLKRHLQKTQNDLIPALHRRASRWFEQNDLLDEAVNHALAAADYAQAMQLIEGIFEASLQNGKILNLLRWVSVIPAEQIRTRPRVCLAYSWSLSAWTSVGDKSRSWEAIEEWMQAALRAVSPEDPLGDAIRAEALVLRANMASIREDFASTLDLSRRALEHLAPDSPWRTIMTMFLGEAHLMVGDARIAVEKLVEANSMSLNAGSNDFWMLTTTHLADAKVARGELREAAALYRQVVDDAAKSRQPVRRASMAYSGLATVLYERNQVHEALGLLRTGREIFEQLGGSLRSMIVNAIPLARVQQAQGQGEDAVATLAQLDQLAQRENVHPLTRATLADYRARLHLAQNDLASVEQWMAESGLHTDDTNVDLARIISRLVGYTTLARFHIRNGKPGAVLGLLERLISAASMSGRIGSLVELHMLQAAAYDAPGDMTRATASLERALRLAEPEGYMRTFVDEGEPMRKVISNWKSEIGTCKVADDRTMRLLAYADKLLAAFPAQLPITNDQPQNKSPISHLQSQLVEPLTERELEVLRLVAEGLSDRQIAEQLTVVVGTVKRHLNNSYGKLGVHRRTEAVARARELGLL